MTTRPGLVFAARLAGTDVFDPAGDRVGKVRDVVVRFALNRRPPRVVGFVVEVAINVGMTLGLMPITGLTLPFVSYGGSSLLVNMIAVGLLNNVGRCRPFTVAPRQRELIRPVE